MLRRAALAAGAAAAAVGCIGEEPVGPDPGLPKRTLLVYMAADNGLAGETARKIEALRAGWRWTGGSCLVYADTPEGARLLRLRGGCVVTPTPYVDTLAVYGADNSASAERFGEVLRAAVASCPADSYGLLFFSHGSGWLPAGTLRNPLALPPSGHAAEAPRTAGPTTLALPPAARSLGCDNGAASGDGSPAEMELEAFAAAIPDGQFDFIVFESCLMAGVEVAYELRNKTDYILASSAEILSPGFTSVYPSALLSLLDTSRDPEEGLRAFGEAYMAHVRSLADDSRSATLSLVATRELGPLAESLRRLLAGRLRGPLRPLDALQHFDRPGSYGEVPAVPRYFDLEEWAANLGADSTNLTVFEEQLKRAVRWAECTERFLPSTNGFSIEHHSGLTTYAERPELPGLNERYRTTAWYRATVPQNLP